MLSPTVGIVVRTLARASPGRSSAAIACLRARGMTYGALAVKLAISEPTVKRMFSRGTFTLARIEQILEVIDLDLQELARLAREGSGRPGELSTEQEAALAQDERLFSV